MMRNAVLCCVLTVLLTSCGNNPLIPRSGGRPYEVLLVDDKDSCVYKALDADVEGLPQSEASFDISTTDNAHYNQATHLARSIVIVNIDSSLYTQTRIRYEKNVYAEPQIIAHIGSPSVTALKRDMPALAPRLRVLLTRAEMNTEIANLKGKHDVKASQITGKMFGMDVWIPVTMLSSKRGKDFLWFSNNSASGMQNICIYSVPITSRTMAEIRDSVMRVNIKGETDVMYMKTVPSTMKSVRVNEKGRWMIVSRGLWEMEGDAMGGPFVSHTIIDSTRQRAVTIEAFVYAPEMKKRNKIRQIEAALYTLSTKYNK